MRRSTLAIAAAATLLVSAIAPAAFARGPGGGMGGGMGGGPPAFAGPSGGPPTWQGSSPPGFSRGQKAGWGTGTVPPGWSKGKKKGWSSTNHVPPGLSGR